MSVREIRLYDSLSGELVPVSAGDAIRVEVRSSLVGLDGGVDVASTRPLVLFSFLERFLRREGFATKFLFDSPDGDDMLYELSERHEPLGDSDCHEPYADRDGEPYADRDGAPYADRDGEPYADRDGEPYADRDGAPYADRDGAPYADRNGERGECDAERDDEYDAERAVEREDEREYDGGEDTGMSLLRVPRSDVDRWVTVCFGTSRDGVDAEPAAAGERILLSDALEHFGHPAVALYLLGTHYSLPLGDALTGLATGSKNASRIREALDKLVPDQPSPPDMRHYMEAFRDALANDLDTPLAFVIMFEWLLEAERRGGEVGDKDLRVMLEVLELDTLAEPVG